MIRGKLNPVDQMALDFNWFLRKMVTLKKKVSKSLLRIFFFQIKQRIHPFWVRRAFTKDRRSKCDILVLLRRESGPFTKKCMEQTEFST